MNQTDLLEPSKLYRLQLKDQHHERVEKFFDELGFDSFAVNQFGNSKPTAHSFGVYLAKKAIGDYTLIVAEKPAKARQAEAVAK